MKKILFLLPFLFAIQSCREKPEYSVITLRGPEAAYNMSRSPGFGSFMGSDSLVPMTVESGDLLLVMKDEFGSAMYLTYREEMGMEVDLYFDTLNAAALYLNGKLHSIDLTRKSEARELLKQSEKGMPGTVETVYLELPLEKDLKDLLFERFRSSHRLNLILEGDDNQGQMEELFLRFKPGWVIMTDLEWDKESSDRITGLKDVRLLAASVNEADSLPFFTALSGIRQLIISSPGDGEFPRLSLEAMQKLESLVILDPVSIDLSFLRAIPLLENLYVLNAGTVTGMDALSDLDELEGLGFTGCSVEGSLPVLPDLEWMCLPVNMGQREFNAFCSRQPEIRVLEGVGNEEVTDLTALENLPFLGTLHLGLYGADLEQLKDLNQLELLVIDRILMEESEEKVVMLRSSLPGTQIVPGGGFCLGSGWLLLILPLFAAAVLIPRGFRKLHSGRHA